MHWAEQYIGRPWSSGSRGPHAFDCWGLLYWIYKHHHGIELPMFSDVCASDRLAVLRAMRDEEQAHLKDPLPGSKWSGWVSQTQLIDNAAVVLGGKEMLTHAAYCVSTKHGMRLLHCNQQAGVVLQTLPDLMRSCGFSRHIIYTHASIHPSV